MKVALTIDSFSPSDGGGEGYAVNLARYLVRYGHEVHVFARAGEAGGLPVSFHRVPVWKGSELVRVLSFALNCQRQLRGQGFDVIQGFGKTWTMNVFRPGGGVHRAWFRQNLRSVEGRAYRAYKLGGRLLTLKDPGFFWLEGRQYRSPQLRRVIANSRLVEGHIQRHYRVDPGRIRVIYNGVDLERFHPERRRWIEERKRRELGVAGELVVLFVAHNFRLKGLHCLIRAVAALGGIQGGCQVWVLGRGKEGPYRKLAAELGCADNLRFLGGQAAMEEYYGAADLLVHPTFYDPSANVCLEAMASGLPVITTRYNGVSELLADGGLGAWVLDDPADVPLLSERVRQLADEELRRELAQRGREIVEGLSWEEHGRQVIQVYREAIALE